MKKFLIFLVIVSTSIGILYYNETSICRNPLNYDIGILDTRFSISNDKLLKTINEAETIWEKSIGRQLFNYRSGSSFKINLVFDERQSRTIQANLSKEEIETLRARYDSLVTDYKIMAANYDQLLSSYNSDLRAFETKLSDYNKRVSELNRQGGVKTQEYKQLENERRELEQDKSSLDSRRFSLNQKAIELNNLGDQINILAEKLNIDVDIHNQRFGEAREFDQGDYTRNRINIYQFDAISDLRLVLAHELGHALGIGHVENPKSIMYYLMDKQDLRNPVLSAEDKQAFLNRCSFHIPKLQELNNILGRISFQH